MIRSTLKLVLLFAAASQFAACSKDSIKTPATTDSTKRTVGMYGHVELYNEYGEAIIENDIIEIRAKSTTDTSIKERQSSPINGRYLFKYNAIISGENEIKEGTYSLYFNSKVKNSYCNYELHKQTYLANDDDSIPNIAMVKRTPAKVEINSVRWSADSSILYIDRTITFTGRSDKKYPVVTRYFLGSKADVCDTTYNQQFVSGAVSGVGGETNSMTITHEVKNAKLQFYLIAYCDNVHSMSYININDKERFPSVGEKSKLVKLPKAVYVKDTTKTVK